MKKKFIQLVATVFCAGFALMAHAKMSYPDKPVTMVCPFAAGGFGDRICRAVAQGLGDRWKSSVIVENRVGVGGTIAASYVIRKPADGYTLFTSNTATDAINPNIYKINFDPRKDFEPVILVVKSANVLVVNKDLPVKSVKELVELARKDPGKLNFGSPGNGTTGQLTGELFFNVAGIRLTAVPYKSSVEVVNDLVGGRVQVTCDNILTWAPLVKSGRVRALAVTSSKRSPLLPDVPTLQELGYRNFEGTSWAGVSVRAGTPQAIVAKLNHDIQAVISTPGFQAQVEGAEVMGGSPAAYKQYIAAEYAKWGKVAHDIGLRMK